MKKSQLQQIIREEASKVVRKEFPSKGSFRYRDAGYGLDMVFVYRIKDKNDYDNYVAIIGYDGEVDIYNKKLTASEKNEIKNYAKFVKSKSK